MPVKIELLEKSECPKTWHDLMTNDDSKPKRRPTAATNRIRGNFMCYQCGRNYIRKDSLQRHLNYECGKEPQFQCPFCPQKSEDLSVQKTWEKWPSHLALPMMLMRESLKESMIQTLNRSASPSPKTLKNLNKSNQDGAGYDCSDCGRIYKLKSSLRNHQKWECGKEPQFKCPYCVYKAKQKMHMARHMERMHREIDYSAVKTELTVKNENSSHSD
ncbi:hypothetical protein HHI36_020029 [Cryptolaemus montrouzieri]|uniref:C2H2-type domain-containing protein n=1 Tax=Cryptolaemus montrouzieri TaxID=559131 RepID=A0ABD2N9T6_9CUCU